MYGYDQRVEAFGAAGMASSANPLAHTGLVTTAGDFYRLTPEQLHGLVTDIDAVLQNYIRSFKTTPSPGSRPVQIHLNAFPLVRGEPTDPLEEER